MIKKGFLRIKTKEYFVNVPGGRIWAIKYFHQDTSTKIPLLILHGGPGLPHNYLEPLAELADTRPIIFYDQLGCGKSDKPDDICLWQLARFVEELQCLIKQLDLKEIYLLGHSWGGALATEYALTNPVGLKNLILASPLLSAPKWIDEINKLKAGLLTIDIFYQLHFCRLEPWPECLNYSMEHINLSVYNTMTGPNMDGNLKNFERIDDLSRISCPVLLTYGRYEPITSTLMHICLSKLQNGRLKIFEQSAHMSMLEEPEKYLKTIKDFLA